MKVSPYLGFAIRRARDNNLSRCASNVYSGSQVYMEGLSAKYALTLNKSERNSDLAYR